ncbi:MAG: FAD-dependent oxidoreductase [Pirellulales bacterium]|nr:FAD-dependent oxidoreductase [Pirellulales bacterium]
MRATAATSTRAVGQSDDAPVAIVGAGFAGLTAGGYLRAHGVPVRVYEASSQVAGLARSFVDDDGFSSDFGAHFITNRLAAAVGFSSHCEPVPRYDEAFWLGARSREYPFGIISSPRFVTSALAAKLQRTRAVDSAADWFRKHYGRALADDVAIPLTEAWSGAPASELSAAVAEKIPASALQTLKLGLAKRISGRMVAIGYCRELHESPHVWHVYPRGGVGAMCEHMAQPLCDHISTRSPVESIVVEDGRATGVCVAGQFESASAVICTSPVHVLAKLVVGTDALQPLATFRYRPMVFVNLRFEGRGLLPAVVLWTPEREAPFFRLTETPLSAPWLAPAGKTIITADIGCQVGDEIWCMSDEELGGRCVEALTRIIPDATQRYLGCRVLRTPLAYPVFLRCYESERRRFAASSGVDGLYSIGRNGEFAHILLEDIYWRTRRTMRKLMAERSVASAC